MQYTVEFVISPDVPKGLIDSYIEYQKRNMNCELGALIHKAVGYENVGYNSDRYRMIIQAFDQRSWNTFKFELKEHIKAMKKLGISTYNFDIVAKMVTKLESIGEERLSEIQSADPTGNPDHI